MAGEVQGFNHVDKADTFTAHRSIRDADPSSPANPSPTVTSSPHDGYLTGALVSASRPGLPVWRTSLPNPTGYRGLPSATTTM